MHTFSLTAEVIAPDELPPFFVKRQGPLTWTDILFIAPNQVQPTLIGALQKQMGELLHFGNIAFAGDGQEIAFGYLFHLEGGAYEAYFTFRPEDTDEEPDALGLFGEEEGGEKRLYVAGVEYSSPLGSVIRAAAFRRTSIDIEDGRLLECLGNWTGVFKIVLTVERLS